MCRYALSPHDQSVADEPSGQQPDHRGKNRARGMPSLGGYRARSVPDGAVRHGQQRSGPGLAKAWKCRRFRRSGTHAGLKNL